jgi:hypothetical protein
MQKIRILTLSSLSCLFFYPCGVWCEGQIHILIYGINSYSHTLLSVLDFVLNSIIVVDKVLIILNIFYSNKQ